MADDWGTPQTGEDLHRSYQKRLARQERRMDTSIVISNLGSLLGATATETIDWNSDVCVQNGFVYSRAGALHAPTNEAVDWSGIIIARSDGSGSQDVWDPSYTAETLHWTRMFAPSPTDAGVVVFGPWREFATHSGKIDFPQLSPGVKFDIQKALDDAAEALGFEGSIIKVFRQPSPPAGPLPDGSVWFDTDNGNHPYNWNATSNMWVDVQDALAVAADAAAAAAQDAADDALADAAAAFDGAVAANAQGRGTELLVNGDFHTGVVGAPPKFWTNNGGPGTVYWEATTSAPGGSWMGVYTPAATTTGGMSSLFPVKGGDALGVSGTLTYVGAVPMAIVRVYWFDGSGGSLGTYSDIFWNNVPSSAYFLNGATSWLTVSGSAPVPDNARFGRLDIYNYQPSSDSWLLAVGFSVRRPLTGTLIQSRPEVNRGIKMTDSQFIAYDASGTPTVSINGTTGNVVIKGSLTAGSDVSGATITGGTIQTEATASRGIKMNSGGLIAYNSTGTIVFQLLATGAILATGPIISAGEVNGAIVTGGTVQTTSLANHGIKINTAGLAAYDAAGAATLVINASTGAITMKGDLTSGSVITGSTFRTDTTGQRIQIAPTGFVIEGTAIDVVDMFTGDSGEGRPARLYTYLSSGSGIISNQYVTQLGSASTSVGSNGSYLNLTETHYNNGTVTLPQATLGGSVVRLTAQETVGANFNTANITLQTRVGLGRITMQAQDRIYIDTPIIEAPSSIAPSWVRNNTMGRDSLAYTGNGQSLPNASSGNQIGSIWTPNTTTKSTSTMAYVTATVNGRSGANQDVEWFLQCRQSGGSWDTIQQVYRQNNGDVYQGLGCTMSGWFGYGSGNSFDVRMIANVAGGGGSVLVGGAGFHVQFFR